MKITTNKIMNAYCARIAYEPMVTRYAIPSELDSIVTTAFVHINDCTLLGMGAHAGSDYLHTDFDRCNYEYNENHFHPDAYVATGDELDFLRYALECGYVLAHRLQASDVGKKFRIIISFNETTYNEGVMEYYGSSTLRFYEIRAGADSQFKYDNLDAFLHDAIMEIEV